MSSSRYYRGQSRRGQFTPRTRSSNLPPERDLMLDLPSTPLQQLSKTFSGYEKGIEIKDLECIGSYNWVEATQPTIIVPGSPRQWKNKTTPFSVPLDTGIQYVDQNGYRMPSSTLLPLFRAVDEIAEDNGDTITWGGIDIVTDRNNLRKLLRWINHDGDGVLKDFRIDTQLAGHTVLFNRWEKLTREDTNMGYGFNFERESTVPAPGCERGTGHHRIVKYGFDGLTMVVRFEVDACLPPPRTTTTLASTSNADDLSDLLSGMRLNAGASSASDATKRGDASIEIIRAGSIVPQDSIIELSTRSVMNAVQFNWGDTYPQLYLSQTPHHFLAIHQRGQFDQIVKRKLGNPELKRIEESAQTGFRKLRILLEEIQELVVEHGEQGRLSLVCKNGELRVFERTSHASCLPDSVFERFGI